MTRHIATALLLGIGLAGETLVESRQLQPLGQALARLRRLQRDATQAVEAIGTGTATSPGP